MIIKSEPVREPVAALVGAHASARVAEMVLRLLVCTAAVHIAVREAAGMPLGLGGALGVQRRPQEGLPGRGSEPLDTLVLRECFHQHGNQHHERRHESKEYSPVELFLLIGELAPFIVPQVTSCHRGQK